MHFELFDLLRLVACLLVTYSHHHAFYNLPGPLFAKTSYGGVGVLIFFSISGFLLSLSQQRSTFKRFSIRRILRIYPALIACTVSTLALIILYKVWDGTLGNQLYYTLRYYRNAFTPLTGIVYEVPGIFSQNLLRAINGSLWTIPYEIYCYCALALGYLVPERFRRWWIFSVLLYLILFSIAVSLQYPLPWLYQGMLKDIIVPSIAFFFAAFIATYPLKDTRKGFTLLGSFFLLSYLLTPNLPISNILRGLAFCSFSVLIGMNKSSAAKKFSKSFGDISYGFYLYSFPIQQLTVAWGFSFWPGLAISIFLCSLVAYTSYHLIEKKFLTNKIKG